jgi:hypothetical protein
MKKPVLADFGIRQSRINLIESEIHKRNQYKLRKRNHSNVDVGIFIIGGTLFGTSFCFLFGLSNATPNALIVFFWILFVAGGILATNPKASRSIGTIFGNHLKSLGVISNEKYVQKIERPITEEEIKNYEAFLAKERAWDNALLAKKKAWDYQQRITWESMDGYKFEEEIGKLLRKNKWNVQVTQRSSDGGIDLFGSDPRGRKVYIQCKRWKGKCQVQPVREIYGVTQSKDKNALAMVICTGGFTKAAKEFGQESNVKLWDMEYVMKLAETI